MAAFVKICLTLKNEESLQHRASSVPLSKERRTESLFLME